MKELAMPYDCYISLGANLGDRAGSLREAVQKIAAVPGLAVVQVSALYESVPWGKLDQPAFLNAVAQLTVNLPPLELLADLQCIESELGRVRHEHWGARTLDLDILFIPGFKLQTEQLTVPHQYLLERAFVLVPLAEIAPGLKVGEKTIQEYCRQVEGKDGVKLYAEA